MPYNVWIIAAGAFFFLAFDEEFEIHENLDAWIHDLLGITETSLTDRIDDVLVVGYALIGITAAIAWRHEILASVKARQMFIVALAIIAVMIVIDAFSNRESTVDALFPSDTASSVHTALFIVEDSLKVYAEAFIALGFVASCATPAGRAVRPQPRAASRPRCHAI